MVQAFEAWPSEVSIIPSSFFPLCIWVNSWRLEVRLDMLLDYCLKPQSPCDDGFALDLVLSCDPSPCHLWVQQDASAVCVCVCYHICRYMCPQDMFLCFFPVLMTWKKCHTAPFIAVVCVTHLILPNCLLLVLQTEHSVIFQCGLVTLVPRSMDAFCSLCRHC